MLNGLDVFSGIGGLSLALAPWVRPVAYCEIDPYCRGVLLSRQADGQIPIAPIWDDIRTLHSGRLPAVDILYGGFPCQDISVAGTGRGLAGERSGLYWEIHRLAGELKPRYVFLENVPAITGRGGIAVVRSLAALGYDCRWTVLSAASVGAPHIRERWWLLGRLASDSTGVKNELSRLDGYISPEQQTTAPFSYADRQQHEGDAYAVRRTVSAQLLADANGTGCQELDSATEPAQPEYVAGRDAAIWSAEWWATGAGIHRVADGVPHRVDRLRALGNAVVPLQARMAFRILLGII